MCNNESGPTLFPSAKNIFLERLGERYPSLHGWNWKPVEDVISLFSLRRQIKQRQPEDDQNLEQTTHKVKVSIVNLLSSYRDSE